MKTEIIPYGMTAEKHVSDVVDYSRDIQPYLLTLLIAGVGAGKNHWVAGLVNEGIRVLEVTSRRSTANSQIRNIGAGDQIDLSLAHVRSGKIDIITNAQLANYCKNQFNNVVKTTWLWNYYDVICLDECQSIVADSVFADSCFYVENFFRFMVNYQDKDFKLAKLEAERCGEPFTEEEIDNYKRYCCHAVFMTGTPEPIEYLFEGENPILKEYNRLDIMEECIHVQPKELRIISKSMAMPYLYKLLESGEKVIYYVSAINNIKPIISDMIARGLNNLNVGIDFSNEDVAEKFDKKLVDKIPIIRESIVNEQKIPDEIQLFITTTRNKEGINLYNPDIHYMFCETAIKCDLIQMAGRVRPKDGIETQFAIYDTYRQDIANAQFELLKDKYCFEHIPSILSKYKMYCLDVWRYEDRKIYESYKEPKLKTRDRLKIVEQDFPMARYNRFSGRIEWFTAKERSIRTQIEEADFVHRCIHFWDKPHIDRVFNDSGCVMLKHSITGEDAIKNRYKGINIGFPLVRPMGFNVYEQARRKMRSIMENLGIEFGVEFNRKQRDEVIARYSRWLKVTDYKKLGYVAPCIAHLGPAIKKLDWTYEAIGHKSDRFIIREESPFDDLVVTASKIADEETERVFEKLTGDGIGTDLAASSGNKKLDDEISEQLQGIEPSMDKEILKTWLVTNISGQ